MPVNVLVSLKIILPSLMIQLFLIQKQWDHKLFVSNLPLKAWKINHKFRMTSLLWGGILSYKNYLINSLKISSKKCFGSLQHRHSTIMRLAHPVDTESTNEVLLELGKSREHYYKVERNMLKKCKWAAKTGQSPWFTGHLFLNSTSVTWINWPKKFCTRTFLCYLYQSKSHFWYKNNQFLLSL